MEIIGYILSLEANPYMYSIMGDNDGDELAVGANQFDALAPRVLKHGNPRGGRNKPDYYDEGYMKSKEPQLNVKMQSVYNQCHL